MGLSDIFKASENKQLKVEVESLNKEIEKLNKLLTPEHCTAKEIIDYISDLENEKVSLQSNIEELKNELDIINNSIKSKKEELVVLDEEVLMQDFGLYKPKYNFVTSDQLKVSLDIVRSNQKQMIKNKTAVNFSENWTVDGSKAKGKKMTNDNIKQIIRTFNTDCENAIDKVKFNNMDSMKKRIEKSFESLNKLNQTVGVSIRTEFLKSKIEELYLAYEYQVKKQEEKEEQKRIREELREQAKLQKELVEARKNTDKDLKHFKNALDDIVLQLENSALNEEQREALLGKKVEIEKKVEELTEKLIDIDYRQSNQKAGYVYVISNIGAFGENIYKIGMTRRLEPQERVDELGDASVPFRFDVHAMIFSEDAPKLENSLHKAFEDRKLNMVNQRREFFNVTLEEIEEVIKANFDKTVEFNKIPEAEQYRESLKVKELLNPIVL